MSKRIIRIVKRILLYGILASVVIATVVFIGERNQSNRVREYLKKIQPGMSKSEIEVIAGKLTSVELSGEEYDVWALEVPSLFADLPYCYFKKGDSILVRFKFGRVDRSLEDVQHLKEAITISLSDTSDYHADFLEAVKMGDTRFIAVMGYATEIPGVPDYYERYSERHGLKIVEGTTDNLSYLDTITSNKDIFGRKYAKAYNTLLLKYLHNQSK